ncbi:MAG: hypothetical protein ACLR43_12195 [Faecalibacillus faecis]
MKKTIKDLIDQEKIHCCQIAVEGIVYEDVYVTIFIMFLKNING